MSLCKKPLLPIDIPLPEHELIGGECVYVRLETLDKLEDFWRAHRSEFGFAAVGNGGQSEPNFLREFDWIFGKSKSAVVRTVLRWGESGVGCEFHELSPIGCWLFKNLPKDYDPFEWFGFDDESISDPNMHIAEVERTLQEMTFDAWSLSGIEEVMYHDREGVNETIAYWRRVQAAGESCYGMTYESDS